jgi:hypothetical protein
MIIEYKKHGRINDLLLRVAGVSTDNRQTFGPRLNITANPFGIIGEAEAE